MKYGISKAHVYDAFQRFFGCCCCCDVMLLKNCMAMKYLILFLAEKHFKGHIVRSQFACVYKKSFYHLNLQSATVPFQ